MKKIIISLALFSFNLQASQGSSLPAWMFDSQNDRGAGQNACKYNAHTVEELLNHSQEELNNIRCDLIVDLSNTLNYNLEKLSKIYSHITELNMSNCNLTQLPDQIRHMNSLLYLDLSHNSIAFKYDDKLRNMRLQALNLSHAGLNEDKLPKELFLPLVSLRRLNLSHNDFNNLPITIINTLKHIDELDLRDNPLSAIAQQDIEKITGTKTIKNNRFYFLRAHKK